MLFCFEVGDDLLLWIIKIVDNLFENKELLFYINVCIILVKKKLDDVNVNELMLVFKIWIKMFYCFVYLKGWVNDVWKLLEFKCSDYLFNIYNLIEYYVVFVGLVVDKIDFISKIEYIVFGEYK